MEFIVFILVVAFIALLLFPLIACIYLLSKVKQLDRELRELRNTHTWKANSLTPPQPMKGPAATAPQPVYSDDEYREKPWMPSPTPAAPAAPPVYTYQQPPVVTAPLVPPPPGIEPEPGTSAFRQEQLETMPADKPIAAPVKRGRTTEEWEMLIGGKWMNWLGAIVLVIGLGFFYKMAVDNGWITKDLRVLLGLVVGAVLLFLGNHFHRKGLPIFSHGLIGAGIAILYLAVYAAYGIYQLPYMTKPLALLSLSIVTAVAIWQSLRYNSIAVVLLAMVGGFLTPVVLHGETASAISHISFFTYLVFLNIALLGVQIKKERWVVVAPLAQICTFVLFGYWLAGNSPVTTLLPLPFIVVLWLLYHGYHCLRINADRKNYQGFAILVLILNAAAVLYSCYRLLEPNYHAWLAPMVFGVAFVYGITGYWVRKLRKDDLGEIMRIDLVAIILLAIASYYQFDGFTLAIVYAIEGLLLVWAGVQGNYRHVWVAAQGIYTLALLAILTSPDALSYQFHNAFFPIMNLRFLAYGSLIGALALSGVIYQKLEENLSAVMGATMKYAVSALGLILIAIEFNDTMLFNSGGGYNAIYPSAFVLMNIAIVIIYILPLVLLGLRYGRPGLSNSGIVLLFLAVLVAAGFSFTKIDVLHFTPLLNMRAIPLMIIIGGLCLYSYFIHKIIKDDTPARKVALEITRILAAGLGFILISLELYTSLNHFALLDSITDHNVMDMLHFSINSCLPLLWTIYAIPLLSYALKQKSQPLFYFSLCVQLLAVIIMGISTINYAPISTFVPILNLRAIPFLLLLAGMAWENYMLGKNEEAFGGISGLRETFRIFIAALIFEFITLEINDYFHRLYMVKDAVNNVTAAGYRFSQQMILPMAWTLFALPVFFLGLRRKATWFTWLGLTALFIGLLWVAFVGFIYSPLNYYSPIFNVRFFAFLLVITGVIVATRQLFKAREEHSWAAPLARLLQIVCALFLLELVSCEVLDYYSAALIKPGAASQHLKEMQQLVLSIGWLLFSILVLAYGFWRKVRNLRLLSMIVFTFTIFKIFLFDLAFLDKGYRVLSIITLGLILFGASYLYQRYKDIIMAQQQE